MNTAIVVAIYSDQAEVEKAIQALRQSDVDMQHVSLVGREGAGDALSGLYHLGSELKYWGPLSTFWGGVWSVLFGCAFFAVPSIGPVLVGGPLVRWIVEALERTIDMAELSAVGAALHHAGLPRATVLECEAALRATQMLLMAHGSATEVSRVNDVLRTTAVVECRVYP